MKRRRLRFTIAALAVLAVPRLASAQGDDFVSPQNCVAPAHISVVGIGPGGAPDPLGEFLVVARGVLGAPLPYSLVTVDFSGCPDVSLCLDPRDANVTVNCAQRTISRRVNSQGEARFDVAGGLGAGAAGLSGCARIYIDGVLVKSPLVSIYDLVGNDGVNSQDLSVWLSEFFSDSAPARDDYDGNGVVGPSDLSKWLMVFFSDASTTNCVSGRCP